MVSKAQVMARAVGDSWLEKGANLLLFGPPGAARVTLRQPSGLLSSKTDGTCCSRTPANSSSAYKSRAANLASKARSPSSTSIASSSLTISPMSAMTRPRPACCSELIGSRYERLSLLITPNQPFGEWGKVFPDQAMTLAAIDRLVHHSTILEMNVESYRRRAALNRKRGPGR
jgi:hypothetical protein